MTTFHSGGFGSSTDLPRKTENKPSFPTSAIILKTRRHYWEGIFHKEMDQFVALGVIFSFASTNSGATQIAFAERRWESKLGWTWVLSSLLFLSNMSIGFGFTFFSTGIHHGVVKRASRNSRCWTRTRVTQRHTSSVSPGTFHAASLNNTRQPPPVTSTSSILDSLNVCDRLCDLETPEGRCFGLQLRDLEAGHPDALDPETVAKNSSHWLRSLLHPDEVSFGLEMASVACRETFFIGRIAVREALGALREPLADIDEHMSNSIPAILKDEHGRPAMPKGYLGSISHKDRAGVGIVTRGRVISSPDDPPSVGIGVDLERSTNSRRNIARRVLTEGEIMALGQIEVRFQSQDDRSLNVASRQLTRTIIGSVVCYIIRFTRV